LYFNNSIWNSSCRRIIGANAIIGIDVKYEAISFTLITVASGTAVVVR